MASPGQIIFWSIISIIIILAGAIALIIGFGISEVSPLVMKGLWRHSKTSLGNDPCFLNCRETLHYSHYSDLSWKHRGGWNPELHF
uniref:V-set domain containing T cell activation inhibitor 1 n=1 Tax=Ailuropoda melanoleuca TaxID=9646 RepID=A0A7N5JCI2_AILME